LTTEGTSGRGGGAASDARAPKLAFATAAGPTGFGPLLFAGRVEEAVRTAAELGYDGIEVSIKSPAELAGLNFGKLLADHGLQLAAIASGRIFVDDGLSLSLPEAARRAEAARRLNELIDLAGVHGALLIVGLVRGPRPVDGDVSAANARLVETLGICADHAAAVGAGIVLEAINRYETTLQCTAAEALDLVEQVGRSNVNVLLDTFHMNIEEVSLAEAIRATGGRLGHFHVADSNRRAPGLGHIDFAAVAAALREIDYRGWISAEILPLPEDRAATEQALVHMRAVLDASTQRLT
jgi:sugar phosphate isomerase/epimerase